MDPHMNIESPKPPTNYAPWPNNACCNYSYPPCYYSFGPPCSHFQPPPAPQFCYHGPYTPYPEPYPTCFIPPSRNPVDQPQYGWGKVNESHCCGCPNHQCYNRENINSVKIEEQSPEVERKDSDSSSLIQLPNYPYPVVWVPNVKDGERDGWIPLDISGIKGLMQGGDEKKSTVGQDKRTQFPWPLVWMPGHEKPEETVKDLKEVTSPQRNLEEPAKLKIVPLKLLENESCVDKPEAASNDPGKRVQQEVAPEKENKTKTIPVNQVEKSSQKKLALSEKEKEKVDENKSAVVEKPKDGNGAKKPSSPTKASKLPPVCLRVDPLPRRKSPNGNYSSSPSPPDAREKDGKKQMATLEDMKKKAPKKDIQVVELKEKSSATVDESCQTPRKEGLQTAASKIEEKASEVKTVEVLDSAKEERKDAEGSEKNVNEEKKFEERKMIRKLAESDAAVIIQAAYRGYEVRRWQPLEKLRKIARVREQIGDIRNQIDHLEASEKLDPKQRVIISETIMNLLLQLDTIQGLHPSVREIRKSVARDLVYLQDKLDVLWNQVAQGNDSNKEEQKSSSKAPEDVAPSEVREPIRSQELLPELNEKAEEGRQPGQSDGASEQKLGSEMASGENDMSNSELEEPPEPVKDVAVSSESEQQEGIPQSEHGCPSSGSEELQLVNEEQNFTCEGNAEASEPEDGNVQLAPVEPSQLVPENESTVVELQGPNAAEHEPLDGEKGQHKDEGVVSSLGEMQIHEDATVAESEVPVVTCIIGDLQPTNEEFKLEEEKPKQQLILERPNKEADGTSAMPLSEYAAVETPAMEGDISNKIIEETTCSQPISEQNESREVSKERTENHFRQSDSTEKPETAQSATEQLEEAATLATGTTDDTIHKSGSEGALREEQVAVTEDETPISKEGPAAQLESSTPETKLLSGPGMNNNEEKLLEENEKLRQMLQKLLEAGKEQLGAISSLNGRVKDLERKLSQKKKLKIRRHKYLKSSPNEPHSETQPTENIVSSAA